jgi:hypothetical protein
MLRTWIIEENLVSLLIKKNRIHQSVIKRLVPSGSARTDVIIIQVENRIGLHVLDSAGSKNIDELTSQIPLGL